MANRSSLTPSRSSGPNAGPGRNRRSQSNPSVSSAISLLGNLNIGDRVQPILQEYLGDQPYNQQGQYAAYVVYRGREPGVFDTWFMTHYSVSGFSGNAYKGFRTRRDAEISYNDWLLFFNRRMRENGTPVSASRSSASSLVPVPAPVLPHSPIPVLATASVPPSSPQQEAGRAGTSPSSSFSDMSFPELGGVPYYIVILGERPGVYNDIIAANAALGLAPRGIIHRIYGELDALQEFLRLYMTSQVHAI